MRIDELSDKELEKLAEAFSKSDVMLKKRKAAEKFFNYPKFLEYIKEREEEIKKRDEVEKRESLGNNLEE
jgi:hypothetical protein